MSYAAAHASAARKVDPRAAFSLRCWARAFLWAADEFGLHEAVDGLQASAVRDGLVDRFGQDHVQAIMAAAFAEMRELLVDRVPDELEDAPVVEESQAAVSTVEALAYTLRTYGCDALRRASTRSRLAELSARQLETVIAVLTRTSRQYPKVTERLLLALAELLP